MCRRMDELAVVYRALRAEEARHVESKAVQIKEWVTAKLRDLEEENQRLREQNARWRDQMELLRRRVCASREDGPVSDTRSLDRQLKSRGRRDDNHDYAEIYTPSQELPPPTPPLHRFPSWVRNTAISLSRDIDIHKYECYESRIYEVAMSGISASCDSLRTDASDGRAEPAPQTLSIPVYATVQGRASQIRGAPLTGESTDSSDNEESPGRSPHRRALRAAGSLDSELSDDYAVPPDAASLDGHSTMERKVLAASHPHAYIIWIITIHIFSFPAMAAALQKIDMDPEQQFYIPKIMEIATAMIEMHGDI
ncbi:PLEKHH2 [Cordylochernes scorpioides]|uniref:PLEKHH2 n=1 Tax=Cordylochernes scorpioides TaxID=51811 RepID=A0ABY6LT62_9ARAC|nr:PLEKHH2 [Cordylochernes scorpioides]